ncbi:hypothetical protein ACFT5B_06960 [Luteimicrobium sp. NPDC057192]|uniref:hypothetical protein n=1 Tax=Luteimicrobium sp. NPDC057192 TaxID=3346042 RepID=UPI00362DB181
MPLIDAYRKSDGRKVRVPAHWIGHPDPGLDRFSKTPRQKAAEKAASQKAQAPTNTPAAGDKKE